MFDFEIETMRFISFIKVGTRQHMENLLRNGVVYMNPIKFFRENERGNARHDAAEGARISFHIENCEVYDGTGSLLLGKASSAVFNGFGPTFGECLYCVYGVQSPASLNAKGLTSLNIDTTQLNFGQVAVLIRDPGEFVKRVKAEAAKLDLKCELSPVVYYERSALPIFLTPFHKDAKFKSQNEIRFVVQSNKSGPLVLQIGSVEDIASLVELESLSELSVALHENR